MTDEWTLKTKAMDIKTVSTDLSKETCPADNEQRVKVSRCPSYGFSSCDKIP